MQPQVDETLLALLSGENLQLRLPKTDTMMRFCVCLLALVLVGQAFAAPAAHDAPQQRIASVLQKPKVPTVTLAESVCENSSALASGTMVTCSCLEAFFIASRGKPLSTCLQFDPTERHLPFMGEGKCDDAVHDANTGFTHVHCLGPAQPLAPGEVLPCGSVCLPELLNSYSECTVPSWLWLGTARWVLCTCHGAVIAITVHVLGLFRSCRGCDLPPARSSRLIEAKVKSTGSHAQVTDAMLLLASPYPTSGSVQVNSIPFSLG